MATIQYIVENIIYKPIMQIYINHINFNIKLIISR